MKMTARYIMRVVASAVVAAAISGIAASTAWAQAYVRTYHNDILRTGWNSAESALSVASVAGGTFNLQHSVTLDDQVDAQPLFVSNQSIAGQSTTHNVVYVATENNTVYAIDAATGAILLSRNLGAPVPASTLPGQCNNNGANVGINSTPVISTVYNTIWVVTYTFENSQPVFRLHALDLGSLVDKVTPPVITASAPLTNGTNYTFNSYASRQRVALMYANGSIYAAFASFCDIRADISRGWLLGWNAYTLAPFASNHLDNSNATSPNNFFLTSIWMSGYGLATIDQNSPIFFVTGNSDYSGTTYNSQTNLAESIVKIAPNLSSVLDYFTPSNEPSLDQGDADFGSGGLLALPVASGPTPRVAVAAGKDGRMFLIDRTNVGHYQPGGNNAVLGTYNVGGCWCGPSYFTGSDGIGRVVSSGGSTVMVWRTNFSGRATLTLESQSTSLSTGQDPGFFTSVSSNGTQPKTAVIWAVTRPTNSNPANVSLDAFDASNSNMIYSAVAGTWPNTGGNSNLVPTVANGRVYVASYKELAIFGLGSPATKQQLADVSAARQLALTAANTVPELNSGEHALYGRVATFSGQTVMLRKRNGALVRVDVASAKLQDQAVVTVPGQPIFVRGVYNGNGTLVAAFVLHAKPQAALWKADR